MSEFLSSVWIEPVATVLGVVGVWLTIRQSLWNFPIGLVQVSLSAVVFYNARLYADMKLQGFAFIVLCYGWYHWAKGGRASDSSAGRTGESSRSVLPVTTLSMAGRLGAIATGVAGTLLWGGYLHLATDAAMPFRDAFIATFSIVSQWLQARKKLENWFGWCLVNLVACTTYLAADLYWFAVLYFLFLAMAVGGYFEWSKSFRKSHDRR